ncbi:MAG TPA: diaminopimelate decarboxylase [Verrucomicrobiales bacterium]|nr:diaminopimelate decarboxylase [Verrucomicrobiales bacterium]
MTTNTLEIKPVSDDRIRRLASRYGTPLWIYQQQVIEQRISELKCFDVVRYAQKANSNLAILALMKKKGLTVDAVSAGEIYRALKAGFTGGEEAQIVYTADIFDRDALEMIQKHRIPVNVGSPDMIRQLHDAGIQVDVTLRINPGFGHGHSRKTNTGGDLSKHGIWHEQITDCVKMGQKLGVNINGLHMHIGSGSDFEHLSKVCDFMVTAAQRFGNGVRTISAGGGLPVPYCGKEDSSRIDINAYYQLWNDARNTIQKMVGESVTLEVEPGRYLVSESGSLLTRICAVKTMGDNCFYLVDAGFNDLIRPAFYGAYHHISIVSQRDTSFSSEEINAVVGGPLCESGDVFTQEEGSFVVPRSLPKADVGDYLILHDTGAYGIVMSSNYNTRKIGSEVLLDGNQEFEIRQRQTWDHILKFERIPEHLQYQAFRL